MNMIIIQRPHLNAVAPDAPLFNNQSTAIGREAIANAGGLTEFNGALVNSGGEVTSYTLGSFSVGTSSHWTTGTGSDGKPEIKPSGTRAMDAQYVVSVTASNASGSDVFTLTIDTVANAWSARPGQFRTAVTAACGRAVTVPAFVLMRSGTDTYTRSDLGINETFNALNANLVTIDSHNASQTWYGYHSTSNQSLLHIQGGAGGGGNYRFKHFRLQEENYSSAFGSAIVSYGGGAYNIRDISFDEGELFGTYRDEFGDYSGTGAAGYVNPTAATGTCDGISWRNTVVHDVRNGIGVQFLSDSEMIGCETYRFYGDGYQPNTPNGGTIFDFKWNICHMVLTAFADASGVHADAVQMSNTSLVGLCEVHCWGFLSWDGHTRTDDGMQGIRFQPTAGTGAITGDIKGCAHAGAQLSGMNVDDVNNHSVWGNTMARPVSNGGTTDYGITLSNGNESSAGTLICRNNVAEVIILGSYTGSNNLSIGIRGATYSYAACFDLTNDNPASRAEMLANFNMKVAGPLDLTINIGAIGSGYVDFDAQTITTSPYED